MKRQLWKAPYQSLGEAITLANAEMLSSLRSEDFQEGVRQERCRSFIYQRLMLAFACHQPRQAAGKNLAGMSVPSVGEPQRQPKMGFPTSVANTATTLALAMGASVTT